MVKEILYGLNHECGHDSYGNEVIYKDCCEVRAETLTTRGELCYTLLDNENWSGEATHYMWDVLTDERGYSMGEIADDYKKIKIENEALKKEIEALKNDNEKLAKKGQKILEILNE